MSSKAETIARLPPPERASLLASLSESDRAALLYDWSFWARPSQHTPPEPWHKWLLCTGRGYGKTRTAAEWFRDEVYKRRDVRGAIVAATPGDARDICVEGQITHHLFKP